MVGWKIPTSNREYILIHSPFSIAMLVYQRVFSFKFINDLPEGVFGANLFPIHKWFYRWCNCHYSKSPDWLESNIGYTLVFQNPPNTLWVDVWTPWRPSKRRCLRVQTPTHKVFGTLGTAYLSWWKHIFFTKHYHKMESIKTIDLRHENADSLDLF